VTAGGPQGPPSGAGGAGPGGGAPPSDEEVQAALEEQLRRLSVHDVLVQTVVTLVNLAARRLGLTAPSEGAEVEGADLDLEQARTAIDASRALLPLVPGDLGPIRDALSQLQVAYARAAEATGAPVGGAGAEAGAPAGEHGGAASAPPAGPPGGAPTSPPSGGPAAPGGEPAPEAPGPDPERERARSKIWTPPGA
jgi:hypothetical protein